MPVVKMKTVMTQSEFNGWMMYLNTKRPEVTEIQLAVLSSLVSNGLGSKRSVTDFIISKNETAKASTAKQHDDGTLTPIAVQASFAGVAIPMK